MQIAGKLFNPCPAPSVACIFLQHGGVSEKANGGVAGFIASHAGGQVLRDLLIEMKLQLIVESLCDSVAAKQCLQAQPQSLSPQHRVWLLGSFDNKIYGRGQAAPI